MTEHGTDQTRGISGQHKGVRLDDIEPSEAGFLSAVRGVAEGVGVEFEPKTPANARILN